MKKQNADNFQVIVIGAGPAGAVVAYELARKGVQVLVLEKENMFRNKPCAGGILFKTANLLPFTISPIVERVIYGFTFTCNQSEEFTRTYEKPIAYTVNRCNFDAFLTEEAKKEGAEVRYNTKVCKIKIPQSGSTLTQVVTEEGSLFANIVVGADGVYSVVAKSLGLNKYRYEYAIKGNIEYQKETKEIDLFRIDWGYLRSGYAWSFPKKGVYSVGAGSPAGERPRLKNYLSDFVNKHFNREVELDQPIFFNPLPFRQNHSPIQRGPCLLVGDAAGLVDPFIREGISSATKSAQIGANIILSALKKKTSCLSEYELIIAEEIMGELNSSEKLRNIFDNSPIDFHRSLRNNSNLWNMFCEILRGNASYTNFCKTLQKTCS